MVVYSYLSVAPSFPLSIHFSTVFTWKKSEKGTTSLVWFGTLGRLSIWNRVFVVLKLITDIDFCHP